MTDAETHGSNKQHSRGIAPLLVLLLFIVSQVFTVLHLIEHTAEGGNDHCEICDAALHLGNAPLPEAPQLLLIQQPVEAVTESLSQFYYPSRSSHYASRAPPAYS